MDGQPLNRKRLQRLTRKFCVSALEEALARFGKPDIFNTDQGSQFTSAAFTGTLATAGVRISMDGRGRWVDNVFIERLWRSHKYEDIYRKGYADGREGKTGRGAWVRVLRRPAPAPTTVEISATNARSSVVRGRPAFSPPISTERAPQCLVRRLVWRMSVHLVFPPYLA